jgi:hypothetical protein
MYTNELLMLINISFEIFIQIIVHPRYLNTYSNQPSTILDSANSSSKQR